MAIGIGETLRTARREQGRSLADAAAQTRVRETYLAALEEEEFDALGGDVYVKGFLRSYARFLGLDPEPLLVAFRAEREPEDEAMALAHPSVPMVEERRLGIIVAVAGVILLLVLLAFVGLRAGGNGQPPAAEPPPSPAQTPPAEAPGEQEEVPGAAPDLEAPAVEGVEVEITVTGSVSWLRVIVDGDLQLEGQRSSGYTEVFHGEDEIVVRVGDGGAVQLVVNGEDQGALGASGQVVQLTCPSGAVVCDREEIT